MFELGSGKQHLTSSQEICLFLIKSSKSGLSKSKRQNEPGIENRKFSGKTKDRRMIFFSYTKDKGTSA